MKKFLLLMITFLFFIFAGIFIFVFNEQINDYYSQSFFAGLGTVFFILSLIVLVIGAIYAFVIVYFGDKDVLSNLD